MVFYEVYSHPELKRYKATIFSKATLLQLICFIIVSLSPFLITYFQGGFWIKEKINSEQPATNFQYKFLVLLESDTNLYVSSSYDNINQIYSDEYLPSLRSVYESITNGINRQLELSIFISGIPAGEIIKNIKLMLLFNNSLSAYSNANFESIAFIESSNSKISTDLTFSGELDFFQTIKFKANNNYNEFNFQYLDQNNLDLESLQIDKILKTFYSRPYGTKLNPDYVFWSNNNADGFSINANIRYGPFRIMYIPGFWEQIKWGWIQYISVLIPLIYVFKLVKIFIFENQLVPTISIQSNKIKNS